MKIEKHTNKGKRNNQEDMLGYSEKVLIVCDGVGGLEKGEVASNMVVNTMLDYSNTLEYFSLVSIQDIISKTQNKLNNSLLKKPEQENMGTTFWGVFFEKDSVFFAHIGDSRIYYIKTSEKQIWHTWDHSFVGNLVKAKILTREEGRHHPMSNRINRAIIANKQQGTVKADIAKADKILEGDIIFVCSDGVNEVWNEYELLKLLCDTSITLKDKNETISNKCKNESKDNNTFILCEIEKEDEIVVGENDELQWIPLESFN